MSATQICQFSTLVTALIAMGSLPAFAQTTPDAGAILREAERQPRQLPQPAPLTAPPPPAAPAAGTERVVVKAFRITGNTLLTEAELQAGLLPWVGRELTFTELQQATHTLGHAYRARGWFARPQLPPQDVSGGIVTIHILEGKLGEIRIDDGGKPLRVERDMVSNTMTARQKPGDPLNLDALERSSNILNDTPGVAVTTILTHGKGPAESDAVVKVQDKPLLAATLQLDNTGNRSTGDKKLSFSVALDNPGGKGDQVSFNGNKSEGITYLKLGYSLPVGRDGARMGVSTSALSYKLVGADFDSLQSKGDAQTVGLNASYPLLRSGSKNITVAAALDRKNDYNEASGVATSEKSTHVGLLSITGDVIDKLGAGGMTLWGVNLSVGNVDLAGNANNQTADQNGPRTAGNYNKLGYNLARLQRLNDKATLWFSFSGQTASKNLDSSEKMSLGGPFGVRAYPVMEGSGDEGWLGALEARYNLTPELQLSAFYDHGSIRRDHSGNYTGALSPATADLKGAGLSLSWSQPGKFSVRTTLAQRVGDNPLRSVITGKDQDGSLDKTRVWLSAIAYF